MWIKIGCGFWVSSEKAWRVLALSVVARVRRSGDLCVRALWDRVDSERFFKRDNSIIRLLFFIHYSVLNEYRYH